MSEQPQPVTELARAKVNLTLVVLGRRPDGYHELSSLVAFADIGDEVHVAAAQNWRFRCEGPTAGAITGDNLVAKAAAELRRVWPQALSGDATLLKRLPVAAGIGGGSSDAAALLRALRRLNAGRGGEPDWMDVSRRIGADVPVCFSNRLAMMRGVGERVEPVDLELELPAVLVNPGVPLSTARVFADLAAPALTSRSARVTEPPDLTGAEPLLEWVIAGGNDLEASALRLAPGVGRVMAALRSASGCRLARLSGSGPTCFGVYRSRAQARVAAETIARAEPDWWVQATILG